MAIRSLGSIGVTFTNAVAKAGHPAHFPAKIQVNTAGQQASEAVWEQK